jgi:hypothetical protein
LTDPGIATVRFSKEYFMRPLLSAICIFACACFAFAGDDRWWELYTPAEQKKLFAEYAQYLHPDKDGKGHPKHSKAREMFASVKGHEGHLVKAAVAWGDVYNKSDKKEQRQGDRLWIVRMELLQGIYRTAVVRDRGPWRVVDKMPDRMIDEFWWAAKADVDSDRWMWMLGSFEQKASRLHDEIRDLAVHNKLMGASQQTVKGVLEKIRKK